MKIEKIIERARVYQFEDADGCVNLGAVLEQQRTAVEAAERFFREAMPLIKVSSLDVTVIEAWNKAEVAIANAMQQS